MKRNIGTTVFGLATKSGIVIGADSAARHPDGHLENFTKLRGVGTRAVIACEGLGKLPDEEGELSTVPINGWWSLRLAWPLNQTRE
jgi:hypothetical protein